MNTDELLQRLETLTRIGREPQPLDYILKACNEELRYFVQQYHILKQKEADAKRLESRLFHAAVAAGCSINVTSQQALEFLIFKAGTVEQPGIEATAFTPEERIAALKVLNLALTHSRRYADGGKFVAATDAETIQQILKDVYNNALIC